MKNHSLAPLIFCATLSLFLSISLTGNSHFPKYKHSDSSSILLKEVIILSGPSQTLTSETPKKMSVIKGPIVNWYGVLMNDPALFKKEAKTISIFTTQKKELDNVVEINFYSLGADKLPDKKLNPTPFECTLSKKGWNEFTLPTQLVVPENGIIIAFRFKKRAVDWHHQDNLIGLGVYTDKKPTFIMDGTKWREFPIYQMHQEKYANRVSMMLKISTNL